MTFVTSGSTRPVAVYFVLPRKVEVERHRLEKELGVELHRDAYGFWIVPKHLVEKLQATVRRFDDEYITESWRLYNRVR